MTAEYPEDLAQWRKAERARLIAVRRAMPLETFRAASAAIMQRAADVLPPAAGAVIGCYWPFRREPDCVSYMRDMVRAGGQVALPVVLGRGSPLAFRPWTDETKMEPGALNILQPAQGPVVTPTALVIPLVGFDEQGCRLGYGAGFYDITLAALAPRPFTVGVGYEFSRLPTIFPRDHDIGLDMILTEDRTRVFQRS